MNIRKLKDAFAGRLLVAAAIFSSALVFIVALALFLRSEPILEVKSPGDLLLGSIWMPLQGKFGFYPFILGTVYVTALAMVFAIPLSILSAVYLAEYANERLKSMILPLIDLLAGIPPVVFGVFGVLAIVPLVAGIGPLFKNSGIPLLSGGSYTTGYSILAGGIVLAIMVFPIIISIHSTITSDYCHNFYAGDRFSLIFKFFY